MLKLENTEIVGWKAAICGTRNSMKGLEKSDSFFCKKPDQQCSVCEGRHTDACCDGYVIGSNDHKLIVSLANDESVRANFRRMITVHVDITAPLYWWNEFDTVANFCSTVHKIHEKEFTLEDFSCEHLIDNEPIPTRVYSSKGMMEATIKNLNMFRELFIETNDKKYWHQIIQLLPSSYNQRRTVMLSYEALAGIYPMSKNHKLGEWHDFCDWIERLPYSELITGPSLNDIPIAKEIMEEAERRVEAGIAKHWENLCTMLGVDLAKGTDFTGYKGDL